MGCRKPPHVAMGKGCPALVDLDGVCHHVGYDQGHLAERLLEDASVSSANMGLDFEGCAWFLIPSSGIIEH
jgi:hypothetical protein